MMATLDTAAIESLRSFALGQIRHRHGMPGEERTHMVAFADMCTAALNGEEWAVERIAPALRCGTWYPLLLSDIIRATDCTRPDGAKP